MNRKILTTAIILLLLSIIIVLIVRMSYCCNGYILKFNSSVFSNIATPIVSLVGVIGLFVTIWLSIEQIRHTRSVQYFQDYNSKIDFISKETNTDLMFPNIKLIKFTESIEKFYSNLKLNHQEYFDDLTKFLKYETVYSFNKPYKDILSEVGIFKVQLILLNTRLLNLLKEIEYSKTLVAHHKDLLFDNLIGGVVSTYIASCTLFDNELKNIKDELFIGFNPVDDTEKVDKLKFFNTNFYRLRDYILSEDNLKKYYK
jgi:hypothetical protein